MDATDVGLMDDVALQAYMDELDREGAALEEWMMASDTPLAGLIVKEIQSKLDLLHTLCGRIPVDDPHRATALLAGVQGGEKALSQLLDKIKNVKKEKKRLDKEKQLCYKEASLRTNASARGEHGNNIVSAKAIEERTSDA